MTIMNTQQVMSVEISGFTLNQFTAFHNMIRERKIPIIDCKTIHDGTIITAKESSIKLIQKLHDEFERNAKPNLQLNYAPLIVQVYQVSRENYDKIESRLFIAAQAIGVHNTCSWEGATFIAKFTLDVRLLNVFQNIIREINDENN